MHGTATRFCASPALDAAAPPIPRRRAAKAGASAQRSDGVTVGATIVEDDNPAVRRWNWHVGAIYEEETAHKRVSRIIADSQHSRRCVGYSTPG